MLHQHKDFNNQKCGKLHDIKAIHKNKLTELVHNYTCLTDSEWVYVQNPTNDDLDYMEKVLVVTENIIKLKREKPLK